MVATSVLASLGTAAGISMALSPLPTMRQIANSRSVGEFSVFPYIATLCQCCLWISYAAVTPGKTALIPVNALVSALELAYCIMFVMYSGDRQPEILRTMFYPAAVTTIGLVISLLTSSPSKFLGFFAVIANIIMYAAPLTVVKTVIETKSVKYMPLLLSLVGTVSAAIWTSWAIAAKDQFVLVPNVLGLLLGCIQLAVYYKYRGNEGQSEETVLPIHSPVSSGLSTARPKANETTGLMSN